MKSRPLSPVVRPTSSFQPSHDPEDTVESAKIDWARGQRRGCLRFLGMYILPATAFIIWNHWHLRQFEMGHCDSTTVFKPFWFIYELYGATGVTTAWTVMIGTAAFVAIVQVVLHTLRINHDYAEKFHTHW